MLLVRCISCNGSCMLLVLRCSVQFASIIYLCFVRNPSSASHAGLKFGLPCQKLSSILHLSSPGTITFAFHSPNMDSLVNKPNTIVAQQKVFQVRLSLAVSTLAEETTDRVPPPLSVVLLLRPTRAPSTSRPPVPDSTWVRASP